MINPWWFYKWLFKLHVVVKSEKLVWVHCKPSTLFSSPVSIISTVAGCSISLPKWKLVLFDHVSGITACDAFGKAKTKRWCQASRGPLSSCVDRDRSVCPKPQLHWYASLDALFLGCHSNFLCCCCACCCCFLVIQNSFKLNYVSLDLHIAEKIRQTNIDIY